MQVEVKVNSNGEILVNGVPMFINGKGVAHEPKNYISYREIGSRNLSPAFLKMMADAIFPQQSSK